MDKIWDENLSKAQIIGCCGWDEKNQKTTENGHSRMQKKQLNVFHYTSISFLLQKKEIGFPDTGVFYLNLHSPETSP